MAFITMPGVQKPHCRACLSRNASWTGCRSVSLPTPSIVTISAPSACRASTVQDFTASPLISTVQAPHCVVSQPTCVPVSRRLLAQELDEQRAALDRRPSPAVR